MMHNSILVDAFRTSLKEQFVPDENCRKSDKTDILSPVVCISWSIPSYTYRLDKQRCDEYLLDDQANSISCTRERCKKNKQKCHAYNLRPSFLWGLWQNIDRMEFQRDTYLSKTALPNLFLMTSLVSTSVFPIWKSYHIIILCLKFNLSFLEKVQNKKNLIPISLIAKPSSNVKLCKGTEFEAGITATVPKFFPIISKRV